MGITGSAMLDSDEMVVAPAGYHDRQCDRCGRGHAAVFWLVQRGGPATARAGDIAHRGLLVVGVYDPHHRAPQHLFHRLHADALGAGDRLRQLLHRPIRGGASGHERDQHALVRTFVTTGPGIAATALTTAFTFGTLLLPGFKGVAELGFIGGSGILLTLLATFTVLPALLVWHERHRRSPDEPEEAARAEEPGDYLAALLPISPGHPGCERAFSRPVPLVLGRVGADFNLLHLQAKGPSRSCGSRRFSRARSSRRYSASSRPSLLAEVKRKVGALKALPSVAKVESIMSVIPEDQAQKLPLIEALRPFLADISLQGGQAEAVDLDALRSILGRIGFKMADNDGGQASQEDAIRQQMHEVRRLIAQFDETTARMGDAEARQALSAFQAELMQDLGEKLALLQANVQAEPVTAADLPPELRAALYRCARPISDYCLSIGKYLGISTADPVRQGRQIGGSRCPRHTCHEF